MKLSFSDDELAFRDEVREFFANRYPRSVTDKVRTRTRLAKADYVAGQKSLYEQGWAAPNWPVEHGGTGWTPTQQYIFHSERAAAFAPGSIPFGLNMVGPVIYTFGSEAQQRRFLPDILASDVWWCQGYSEPGAGSDLASLRTTAARDGDHWVINGTKTWTTYGQYADWIFLLARTTQDTARKQQGISFLVADMRTPGISVRPIITIDGEHEVNEVHFDDVRVPVDNLIGKEGKGWSYGKVLLQHERTGIADVARSKIMLQKIRALAADPPLGGPPLIDDPEFARRLAEVEIELKALEFTDLRTLATISAGGAPGAESSILKIKGTEMQQALQALYLDLAGYYALPYLPEQFDGPVDERIGGELYADTAPVYFNYRKVSIYGGSNEIQRNIVAKHVLGL